MRVTITLVKALWIIAHKNVEMPSQFAMLMWPDAEAWSRHTKCGYGTTRGGGIKMAGGAYLGKLWKRGLIRQAGIHGQYYLTDEGLRALQIKFQWRCLVCKTYNLDEYDPRNPVQCLGCGKEHQWENIKNAEPVVERKASKHTRR